MELLKAFPKWYDSMDGGIFHDLAQTYSTAFEWLTEAATLDLEYYGNHSGEKTVSPIIDKFVNDNIESELEPPEELTATQRAALAGIVANRFSAQWEHLYALLSAQYNPIENYNMKEETTPDLSTKHLVSNDYVKNNTKTSNFDYTVASGTNSGVYGFNSSDSVPAATADTSTTTSGLAKDNIETNAETQTGYTEETQTGKNTVERSGNIGVTTTQQMMESEIELWKWSFFETVYRDIDTVLTVPVYKIFKGGKTI